MLASVLAPLRGAKYNGTLDHGLFVYPLDYVVHHIVLENVNADLITVQLCLISPP